MYGEKDSNLHVTGFKARWPTVSPSPCMCSSRGRNRICIVCLNRSTAYHSAHTTVLLVATLQRSQGVPEGRHLIASGRKHSLCEKSTGPGIPRGDARPRSKSLVSKHHPVRVGLNGPNPNPRCGRCGLRRCFGNRVMMKCSSFSRSST
jgi:hypothetical protein